MFNKRTVIVVGAGASKEAGLPTGQELKAQIAHLLNIKFDSHGQKSGDDRICDALRLHVRQLDTKEKDINPHLRAAWHICEAMPQAISIDNFIDAHNGDKRIETCGKLAIVQSILKAEKQSHLYVDHTKSHNPHPNFSNLENTWYNKFFQLMTENCRAEDLAERMQTIALIIFNYDRCVEHFLHHALQNYYKINPQEATTIIQQIEIHHPYGKVGSLPWQAKTGAVSYGAEPSPQQLLELAKQIKTFTEGTDPDSSEVASIRENMSSSDILVFLGFAFHKLNMKLLTSESTRKKGGGSVSCYATAKGISSPDCERLKLELNQTFGDAGNNTNVRNDLFCSELFQEYWRSLSLT